MKSLAYIPQQPLLVATPVNPDTGFAKLYAKDDGDWYLLDPAGNERFVFSPHVLLYQDLAVSSTTSAALQDKINQTSPVLPAGTYQIATSYGWNYNSGTADFIAGLLVDGTPVEQNFPAFHRQEPQDTAGGGLDSAGTGTDQAHGFSRLDYLVFPAATTHNFRLQWASSVAGQLASIWNASVMVKRVS